MRDQRLFSLAGIWRDDGEVTCFAMLTVESSRAIRSFHAGAMPVIIPPDDRDLWLTGDWKSAQKLVKPPVAQNLVIGETVPGL